MDLLPSGDHRDRKPSILFVGDALTLIQKGGCGLIRLSLIHIFGGYGISTVCASTTPFGLALAPGLLGADEPSSKNLRLSANMIPVSYTHLSLLMLAIIFVVIPAASLKSSFLISRSNLSLIHI